jgi:hypothetical protein
VDLGETGGEGGFEPSVGVLPILRFNKFPRPTASCSESTDYFQTLGPHSGETADVRTQFATIYLDIIG